MHDFSVFRTVSGPYDVPLDDPKPRFGQQRRKNRPRPCCHAPFLYGSTLDLRGISSRSSKRPHAEAGGCGRRRRCRAPCLGRARTRARPCAPPRCALHSSQRALTYPSSPHAAATWQAARADAWEKQKLGSNLEEGRIPFSVKVPAQGRCGAIGRRASPRSSHALCSFSAPRYPCPLTSPSSARAQVCCSGPVWAR